MSIPYLSNDGEQARLHIPQGWGYWDLTFYPWGGKFCRASEPMTATRVEIVSRYPSGNPKRVTGYVEGVKIGVQIA